jgi:hypothetical protein
MKTAQLREPLTLKGFCHGVELNLGDNFRCELNESSWGQADLN